MQAARQGQWALAKTVRPRRVRRAFCPGWCRVLDYLAIGREGVIGAPFGGYRHSGFGRSMGPDFVEDWTQVKAVIIKAPD
jgi:aldehyde dehydrogenase (NAD+)